MAESYVWLGDRLLRLPRTLMGVPLDPDQPETAAVLTDSGLARLRAERALPASRLTADVSVGELVAERCGREVVDRLVEPLLGGVYAGHADLISARAALPRLVEYFSRGSILAQAGTIPTTYAVPVFAGIPGGMARLPSALVDSGRFAVRTAAVVRELRAVAPAVDGARFELVVGSAAAPDAARAGRRPGHSGGADGSAADRGRPGGRPEAGRDRVGVGGGGHARLPRRRAARPPRIGAARPAERGPADQGVDVLLREVGLGARGGPWPRRRR
ncbi:MAG: hypothetical protein R2731_06205 [Nocardioides sp.]